MCRSVHAKAIDRAVFPGTQGGPLMHIIAAKAVAFKEALTPEFSIYQHQIVASAKALSDGLTKRGFKLISGGTDNHLMLVDLTPKGITGKQAEEALERVGITVNKNAIPFDTQPPAVAGGIRLGTPIVTTRRMKEPEMDLIAEMIDQVLSNLGDKRKTREVKLQARELCKKFPFKE